MIKILKTSPLKLAITAVAVALLAACTTTTPYQQAVRGGDGYSEQKLERDKYRIVFSGNSLTDRVTVENYVLYRAAEVTLASGNDYFIMLEDSADIKRSFQTTGVSFGGHGFGRRGFFYGGFGRRGFGHNGFGRSGFGGFGSSNAVTRERTEYTIGAIIQLFKGTKPAAEPTAFDARSVIENLGPALQRPAS